MLTGVMAFVSFSKDTATIKKLAEALHIRVSDFLASRNTSLVFEHGKFCNPF